MTGSERLNELLGENPEQAKRVDRIISNLEIAYGRFGIAEMCIKDRQLFNQIWDFAATSSVEIAQYNLDIVLRAIIRDHPDYITKWMSLEEYAQSDDFPYRDLSDEKDITVRQLLEALHNIDTIKILNGRDHLLYMESGKLSDGKDIIESVESVKVCPDGFRIPISLLSSPVTEFTRYRPSGYSVEINVGSKYLLDVTSGKKQETTDHISVAGFLSLIPSYYKFVIVNGPADPQFKDPVFKYTPNPHDDINIRKDNTIGIPRDVINRTVTEILEDINYGTVINIGDRIKQTTKEV